MNKRPAPNTGTELIKLCVEKLDDITPDQKKRYIDTWCEILNYGIKRHSMNDKRWQPPEDEIRKENANKFERSSSSSKSNVANTKSEQSISKYYREQPEEVSEQKQIESRGSYSWTLREADWLSEPDVGRVVDGLPGRAHRLRGLGNAIVPKIAEEIGRAIIKAESKE